MIQHNQAHCINEDISLSTFDRNDFLPRFFRLAIANILSNLTVPLAGLISVAFLGHLIEIRHLAGATLATVLFNYLYRSLGFLRISTTGLTAQALGRKDKEAELLIGLRNSVIALALGFAILIFHHPLQELGFALFSAAPEVKSSGQAYYEGRIWAAPATLLNFVLIGWFMGREQGGKVLALSVVANGTNILLDYLYVIRWGVGKRGGWYGYGGQPIPNVVSGDDFVYRDLQFKEVLAVAEQILDRSALKATFALNADIFVRTLTLMTAFAVFTSVSSVLGTMTLAENALLLQVVSLAAFFIDGLAFATESLGGNFLGKKANEQLVSLVQVSGVTSLISGLTFALLFILFPEPLFGLLTNHFEVISGINLYVPWLLPVLGFGSIAFMLDGYFLGLAEGSILRNAALTATLVGFAPIAIVAWLFHSSHLLWLAMSVFMVARVITLGVQVPRTLRG